jgi:hypothetical protein
VIRKYSSQPERRPGGGPGGGEGGPFGGGAPETLPVKAGMNRFVWDLREKGAIQVPGCSPWAATTARWCRPGATGCGSPPATGR